MNAFEIRKNKELFYIFDEKKENNFKNFAILLTLTTYAHYSTLFQNVNNICEMFNIVFLMF